MLETAMEKVGVKYGYLTTYMQTIFVKMKDRGGRPALSYSRIIKHSDFAEEDKGNETMKTVSLKFALFYVLCEASKGHPRV
jgi:hypothetical protein